MLQTALTVTQAVIAVLLILSILLQAPEQGLSPVFGGGGETYRSKRNVEKFLVTATIVLAAILVLSSVALLLPQI